MPTQNNPQDHGTSGPSEIVLPPDGAIANDNQNPRRRRAQADADQAEVGLLVEPQPRLLNLL